MMVDVLARLRRQRLALLEAQPGAQREVGAADLDGEIGEMLGALLVVAADVAGDGDQRQQILGPARDQRLDVPPARLVVVGGERPLLVDDADLEEAGRIETQR